MGALTDWSRNISIGTISSTYHILPQKTVEISKGDSGNKTFTITICKKGETDIKSYAFRLISLPTMHFIHAKAGFADIVYNARNEASFVCSNICGNISNVREITHNGANYLACDVDVNQYGSNTLYIVGLHADLSEIMDVTGNFSEIS